jgi:hypothetical protein
MSIRFGRHTVALQAPCVLFLIGMRVNRWRAMREWVPVAKSMGPMIAELSADPDSGFLAAENWVGWRRILVQQYWRSTDDLIRYAGDAGQLHRPAWTAFMRNVGIADGASVGIFHETIELRPGQVECIHGNMPAFGLGRALGTTPATGHRKTAADRLLADQPPA